jgi:3-oxoacyl-[acyl-carrier-protein] synthase III
MKFKNVVIQSLAAVEPPIRVTSKEIEEKLKPTLSRLGVRDDLLEEVSGIGARRFWKKVRPPPTPQRWPPKRRSTNPASTVKRSGSSSIHRCAGTTWSLQLHASCTEI